MRFHKRETRPRWPVVLGNRTRRGLLAARTGPAGACLFLMGGLQNEP